MPREVILNIPFDKKLLLKLASLFAQYEGTCLLYSGGGYDSSCCSYLSLFPYEIICQDGEHMSRRQLDSSLYQKSVAANPWDALKELLPVTFDRMPYPEWTGFLGYEMGAFSDKEKWIPHPQAKTPNLYLQRSRVLIAVDHREEKGRVLIADQASYMSDKEILDWVDRLGNPHCWKELLALLDSVEIVETFQTPLLHRTPFQTLQAYTQQIEQAKEWILGGDIYQLNLSQKLVLEGKRDPFYLFSQLAEINPAPFSAYLKLDGMSIVSSSPERFLKKNRSLLETRPIKGTIPRGKSEEEDRSNRDKLLASEKNRAELLMITDLMRNDLGRISLPGSVVTQQIVRQEAYSNVHHLLSIIQAQAQPHLHPIELIRACFPGGSITGCPKLRAMERIVELEKAPRGIYTGSIGYLAGNGDFDFNIAIRTLVQTEDEIELHVGGAITSDSDPLQEYEETLHKGSSMLKVLGIS
ncbi:MAG: aminodeoxychorismate synthase component I [Parachlamydia sp.]|nr:aminodeoxychorismate synthase component I [Parachlamydia sp.]